MAKHAPFHERVVLVVAHQTLVDVVVGHVDETFEDHDGRNEEDLLLVGEAQIRRPVLEVVQDVVLADLIGRDAVNGDAKLGVRGASILPRVTNHCHRLS